MHAIGLPARFRSNLLFYCGYEAPDIAERASEGLAEVGFELFLGGASSDTPKLRSSAKSVILL
jgi:hypothetical protein